eukprot:TRINITY_DN10900_c0_g1_i1.p1 TRINITY_DN10900_c0_g1~~TRINITY_DN10900_c0_g1_i1.p1  ORF type:complete len:649 (+),score=98.13 TRINITY_DN10900_c0_g1_i1:38-1984(+)
MLLALGTLLAGPLLWLFGTTLLFPRLFLIERVCASIACGFATSVWTTLVFAHMQGTLDEGVLVRNLVLHMGCAYALTRLSDPTALATAWDALHSEMHALTRQTPQFLVVASAAALVSYIMNTHIIPPVAGELWTSGNCYADLPFHLTVLNSFLYGKNSKDFNLFAMSEVIFDGHRLVYPIVPDYLSAMLVRAGLSHRWALLLPSIMLAWAFFFMLYFAALRFTHRSSAAVLTVFLTLFCGGNYEFKEPKFWLFFIKDIFLPQRSAMFAYTTLLAATVCLWIGSEETKRPFIRHRYYQLSGFMTALLPYLQGHAYICMSIIAGSTLLLVHVNPKKLSILSTFLDLANWAAPALLFGFPQMFSYMQGASRWGFARYAPMWTYQDLSPLQWYWDCLGLFLYVAIAGTFLLNGTQLKRISGFWLIFIISSFLNFQPWEVDNMKLFYVSYFGLCFLVGVVYDRLVSRNSLYFFAASVLVLSFMVPGIVCIVKKELREQYPLLSRGDVELGEWVRFNTGPEAVFLTSARHNHPVSTWGGKSLYYGYKGWLSSRGLEWQRREEVARKIVTGAKNALELCRDRGIDYVALSNGARKLENVDINRNWLREHMVEVYRNDEWTVFEVKEKSRIYVKKMFGPLYYIEEGARREVDRSRH